MSYPGYPDPTAHHYYPNQAPQQPPPHNAHPHQPSPSYPYSPSPQQQFPASAYPPPAQTEGYSYPASYAQPAQYIDPNQAYYAQPGGQYPVQNNAYSPQPAYHPPSQPDFQPQYQAYQHLQAQSPSLASPAVVQHSPIPPQPPIASPHVGVDPSLIWQPPPAQVPSVPVVPPQTSTPKPKVTLRIARPTSSTPAAPEPTMHPRRSSSSVVKTEEVSTSGRPVRSARLQAQAQVHSYIEMDEQGSDVDGEGEADGYVDPGEDVGVPTRSGRVSKKPTRYAGEDDFEDNMIETSPVIGEVRRGGRKTRRAVVDPDEEEDEPAPAPPPRNAFPARSTRNSLQTASAPELGTPGPSYANGHVHTPATERRSTRRGKSRHSSADAESFEPSDEDAASDGDASSDPMVKGFEEEDDDLESRTSSPPRRNTRTQARRQPPRRSARQSARHDSDEEYGRPKRNLRERAKVNYELPPMDISAEILQNAIAGASRPGGGKPGRPAASRFGKGLPWMLPGADRAQAMGDPDTSDSDDFAAPPKAPTGGAGPGPSAVGGAPRVTAPTDVPNFGRINPKSNMADADPLGVDMNVTFDNVGGLDDHINQLKEMVALPLLYPELFQQFGITPPRGVLFHGPPGTGKTLLARALAASCSSGNTKIAFFMRKGADVLSKWVGEAERQLRMLFEEARAAQPSIIFFDEIDGLAPVRSSKQDQIHASLVSTLLALMDGMDGRGQVIVIGATNRPDAVDPALRRPGRFDREFYFPLPNKDARKRIIGINTRKWDPRLSDDMLDRLATLTKGYGGADLRALCTEAALNAIQRRYPQIYRSTDRYELNAKSIQVQAKDFMMSIKKIIPSSARSTSSSAIQLPHHLVPLLSNPLDQLKAAIDAVLPRHKTLTALEEAQYEEDADEFEKHLMLQSLDKLRTFRPRVLVTGPRGMGQAHLGPAVLHHLEGFHVQSFDLGTLLGDSARTVEAALVQLFVEAKRHQPSVIYIPSLSVWANTLSESARATFSALLEGIPPSDPVLVLGIAEHDDIPFDVRSWFGWQSEGLVELVPPSEDERADYFSDLLAAIQRAPTEFPDAIPRKPRVLEQLPLAAPLPPRAPTEAEIAREAERDHNARNMLVVSFTQLVQEFMRKYRKVVSTVREDATSLSAILAEQAEQAAMAVAPSGELLVEGGVPLINGNGDAEGDIVMSGGQVPVAETVGPHPDPLILSADAPIPPHVAAPVIISAPDVPAVNGVSGVTQTTSPTWQAHPIDMDVIQRKLVRHKYFTPSEFLHDISLVEENASRLGDGDRQAKVAEMAANARLHVSGFDPKWTPEFEAYAERMRARKKERARVKEEAAKVAAATTTTTAADAAERGTQTQEAQQAGEHTQPRLDQSGVAGTSALGSSSQVNAAGAVLGNGQSDGANGSSELGLKRAREGESLEAERETKRSRDDISAPAATSTSTSTSAPIPVQISTPTSPVPASLALETEAVLPPSPTVPAPKTIHPPFVLPTIALSELAESLRRGTEGMSIEELEQLRASCFDRVWRRRGEWDRTAMMHEVRRVVQKFVDEAGRRREREREREREAEMVG